MAKKTVNIRLELDERDYEYYSKMAKGLRIEGGVEELFQRELVDFLAERQMWIERHYIAELWLKD